MTVEGVHPGLELWHWGSRHGVRSSNPCSQNCGFLQMWHSSKFCLGMLTGSSHHVAASCSHAPAVKCSQKLHPWIRPLWWHQSSPQGPCGHLHSVWGFEQLHCCPNIGSVREQHLGGLPHGRVAIPAAARHKFKTWAATEYFMCGPKRKHGNHK